MKAAGPKIGLLTLAFATFTACTEQMWNKGQTAPVKDNDQAAKKEERDALDPVAVAGTNLVDPDNGALGVDVDYSAAGLATLKVVWYVKKTIIQNGRSFESLLPAGGFADGVTLSGNYEISINGQDASSLCAPGADKTEFNCKDVKVESPRVEAVARASIAAKAGKVAAFEAKNPYIAQVGPSSQLASGGVINVIGSGFAQGTLQVSIAQGSKSVPCDNTMMISDSSLKCSQPEMKEFSGSVDVKVAVRGQSFTFRNAYRVVGRDLFLNTNCDQAIASFVSPSILNVWESPRLENTAGVSLPSGVHIPNRYAVSTSTITIDASMFGTVYNGTGAASWCTASTSGARNSGSMQIGVEGKFAQEIPLFCSKQLVYLIVRNGQRTAVGIVEVNRTDCSDKEIMATLSWGAEASDLELHLIREGGTLNNTDGGINDCTWTSCLGNTALDWGVVGDNSDNPTKDIDWTGVNGTENITLPKPENKTYGIWVEYWGSGFPSDARVTVNALGKSDSVLLSEVQFFDAAGSGVKGALLAPRMVWQVGTVQVSNGIATIRLNKNVANGNRPLVAFDCAANWSGGCRTNTVLTTLITPATATTPIP